MSLELAICLTAFTLQVVVWVIVLDRLVAEVVATRRILEAWDLG